MARRCVVKALTVFAYVAAAVAMVLAAMPVTLLIDAIVRSTR